MMEKKTDGISKTTEGLTGSGMKLSKETVGGVIDATGYDSAPQPTSDHDSAIASVT